jgi:predicted nucleic acid-binding protein
VGRSACERSARKQGFQDHPQALRENFNAPAEQLCVSSVTLGELHYGAEKSARRADNLLAILAGSIAYPCNITKIWPLTSSTRSAPSGC